jgi:hypothetical protein
LLAANAPVVGKALQRRPLLWHGTPSESAVSILANPNPELRGILTRYAGKEARANSSLLANAIIKELEASGVRMPADAQVALYNRVLPRIAREDARILSLEHLYLGSELQQELGPALEAEVLRMRNRDVSSIVMDELRYVLRQSGKTEAEIDAAVKSFEPKLSRLGKRIYYGATPTSVIGWGVKGGESAAKAEQEVAVRKLRSATRLGRLHESLQDVKRPKRAVPWAVSNMLTLGLPDTALDAAVALSARPDETLQMTREEAAKLIERESRSGKLRVVLGAKGAAKGLDYMTDFPGLGTALAANPGLKQSLKSVMPNYDPGKDISMPGDMPVENIKEVRLLDLGTGSHTRIKLLDYKKPKVPVGARLANLGRVGLPIAGGLVGADILQAAIRGRHSVLSNLVAGKEMRETRRRNYALRKLKQPALDKTSAFKGTPLPPVGKLVLPVLGGFGATAVPGAVVSTLASRAANRAGMVEDDKVRLVRAGRTGAAGGLHTAGVVGGLAAGAAGGLGLASLLAFKHPLRAVSGARHGWKLMAGLSRKSRLMGAVGQAAAVG